MRDPIAALDDLLLDDLVKGFPGGHAPVRLGDVGRQGWNVLRDDLPTPLAVLKTSALDANGAWMARFLARTGARLAPHGKTTMSPQLFRRQLDDGAWAITVATVGQLLVCRRFGLDRLVLANQLVGKQALRTVVAELVRDPSFELHVLVDSAAGVEALAAEAALQGLARPVKVLLEVGFPGGRAGCRTRADALAVARAVAHDEHVALAGVEGFEGLISGADDEARVAAFLDQVVDVARECRREGLFAPGPVILSAGGSAWYDVVAQRLAASGLDAQVVLRCGCYLTHDAAHYAHAHDRVRARAGFQDSLRPALELWTHVQSRPEPGRAILTAGKRDVSHDADLPVALVWSRGGAMPAVLPAGHVVVALNDQHAHLQVPADSPLRVGDLVALGVSHPCTTFDKWQVLWLVDDGYDVVGAVRTFF